MDNLNIMDFEQESEIGITPISALQSNTNPIVNSQITGTTPVLAASGQNQALTKPYNQMTSLEKLQYSESL